MAGHRNFRELAAKLDQRPDASERRGRARAELNAEIEAYERGLAEVRRARRMTQQQLARALEVSQAQVSRIEHQTDLYLSTLKSYIEALGGELVLAARFEDTDEIEVLSVEEHEDAPLAGSSRTYTVEAPETLPAAPARTRT